MIVVDTEIWDRIDALLAGVQTEAPNVRPMLAEVRGLLAEVRGTREAVNFLEQWVEQTKDPYKATAKVSSGYTGDFCATCNSDKMIRTGTCMTCMNCGDTSGCS